MQNPVLLLFTFIIFSIRCLAQTEPAATPAKASPAATEAQQNKPGISDADCQKFKKGKFMQEGNNHVFITRKAHYQTEIDRKHHRKSRLKIEWKSSCAYTMTLKKVSGKGKHPTDKKYYGLPLDVTITKVDGEKYIYKSVMEKSEHIPEEVALRTAATMIKVKKFPGKKHKAKEAKKATIKKAGS